MRTLASLLEENIHLVYSEGGAKENTLTVEETDRLRKEHIK